MIKDQTLSIRVNSSIIRSFRSWEVILHEKLGGRQRGTSNKATLDLKQIIDRMLPDEELWKLWKKMLYSRDQHIAIKALEMALHYRYGKPMTIVAGPEEQPPIKIDISAIPKFRMPVKQ